MPAAKKTSGKGRVKVKDLKAKKNPKGGFSWGMKTAGSVNRKAVDKS